MKKNHKLFIILSLSFFAITLLTIDLYYITIPSAYLTADQIEPTLLEKSQEIPNVQKFLNTYPNATHFIDYAPINDIPTIVYTVELLEGKIKYDLRWDTYITELKYETILCDLPEDVKKAHYICSK